VPCVKDIGLWGDGVQRAFADLGVLDAAKTDLEALMRDDEQIAEETDRRKYEAELAARRAEVDTAVAGGAGPGGAMAEGALPGGAAADGGTRPAEAG